MYVWQGKSVKNIEREGVWALGWVMTVYKRSGDRRAAKNVSGVCWWRAERATTAAGPRGSEV